MPGRSNPLFSENQWHRVSRELNLSPRQGALAQSLLLGRSDKQIAREMGITVPTVRSHITRLFRKFDVSDRIELILYFVGCLQSCYEGGLEMSQASILAEMAAE